MEGHAPPRARGGASGVFNLVPATAPHLQRKFVSARFPLGYPSFSDEDHVLGVDPRSLPAKQQQSQQPAPPPALVLSSRPAAPGGQARRQFAGVPRTDGGSNYFLLTKAGGRDFMVLPLDAAYTFKPVARPSALTIEEVEAGMQPQRMPRAAKAGSSAAAATAAASSEDPKLLPKSMRAALHEQAAAAAADRQLKEDIKPLLKSERVAELATRYGSSGPAKPQLLLGASDEESEEGLEPGGGSEDDMPGGSRRRGAARGAGRARPGDKSRRSGTKASEDAKGEADALAEDIYAGEEDELRPEAPAEDVDWEFAEGAADDDLEMGASDEEGLDDDPGYRKQLGIEGEEEEEEDEKAKREAERAADAAAGDATGPGDSAAAAGAGNDGGLGGVDAGLEEDDEWEDDADDTLAGADDEHFDADDLDRLAAEAEARESGQPPTQRKGSAGLRERSVTPPPPPSAASKRLTPPPPAAGAKRRREGQSWAWSREQLDASGVPTSAGIVQALAAMGPIPVDQLHLLQDQLNLVAIGDDGKKLLKSRLLQVAKVGLVDGRRCMVLK